MPFAVFRSSPFILTLLLVISGCGYFHSNESDAEPELSAFEKDDTSTPVNRPADKIKVQNVSANVPSSPGILELKLTLNEPFPLVKTVEQRLTETDGSGQTGVSTSRTEMVLSLNVDDIRPDGNKKMTVRYHRVSYREVIRGVEAAYSSEQPNESIPRNCLLYAGLSENFFSFVLGPNNKVVELVDFNEFLQRCLRKVPTGEIDAVRQQLETTTRSDDGIATFIDDSIGLLPYSNDPARPGVEVSEGFQWEMKRHSDNPLPLDMTTTCTLNELTNSSAEIVLVGRIASPPNPVVKRGPGGEFKILVKGGFSSGSCRVDRKTGLPTQSFIQRHLLMTTELPNGQKIDQSKETISTITSYLVAAQHSASTTSKKVQQTNLQQAIGSEKNRTVQQAVIQPQ